MRASVCVQVLIHSDTQVPSCLTYITSITACTLKLIYNCGCEIRGDSVLKRKILTYLELVKNEFDTSLTQTKITYHVVDLAFDYF